MKQNLYIPRDWDEQTLGEITSLLTNGFVGTATSHYTKETTGATYIQGFNVTENSFNLTNIRKVTQEFHKKNSKSCLQEGDLLTIQTGDIGLTTIVPKELEGSNCHALVISRFDRKTCHPKFYTQYFNSPLCRRLFRRIETGSSMKHLNVGDMKKLYFPIPPLPEQKAIANLLSTWDEAIEKTERLIQAKGKRFKWLLRELISESQMDTYKHRWKKVKVGSFLTESRIPGSNGLEAQKITVKLYGKGVIPKKEKRIGSTTTKYYVRKQGQFVYSKLDFLNGAFGVIPEELDGFESTLDLPAFDISKLVSKEWFRYYLIRPEYYSRQLGLAKGQRKARRVNPSEFLNSKILLPPLEEQQQIAEALTTSRHEIDLLKQLADKYKTQKRGLMQKMLTGEWRVKPEIVNQYMEA